MTIPGLKQKEICFEDIVELAMLFLLVPLMVNWLIGLTYSYHLAGADFLRRSGGHRRHCRSALHTL